MNKNLKKSYFIIGLLLSILLINACSNEPQGLKENEKPNVIIIYTDDQGSIDVNCYGAKD